MLNNYTAHKKPRSDDQYSPDGEGGRRPDYATVVYGQRCRQVAKDVPIIAGGVEVSMRRLAHYDYWSDKIRKSMILDSRADLVVYGMGEKPLLEIISRLKAGQPISACREIWGVGYAVGKKGLPHFVNDVEEGQDWIDSPPEGWSASRISRRFRAGRREQSDFCSGSTYVSQRANTWVCAGFDPTLGNSDRGDQSSPISDENQGTGWRVRAAVHQTDSSGLRECPHSCVRNRQVLHQRDAGVFLEAARSARSRSIKGKPFSPEAGKACWLRWNPCRTYPGTRAFSVTWGDRLPICTK